MSPESGALIEAARVGLTLGGTRIYDDFSLAIPKSSFCFLLGPSGCGKSTLLRLFAGLLEPGSGSVRIGGRDALDTWQDIAFVFQSPRLVPWRSALDNVALAGQLRSGGPARQYRERAADLLARLGLGNDLHKVPAMLSGGERQRVALARAFLLDTPIILMDEPFSALDLRTRERLREELGQLWSAAPRTVVFVTHDIDDALSLADHIVVLGTRPARIVDTITVAQDRPRHPGAPALAGLRGRLERLLTH